jgi:hypothetical protein
MLSLQPVTPSPEPQPPETGEERAIVVGNAQEGLVKWVASREDKDEGNRLITAKHTHARGILEGLRMMGFLK